MVPSAFPVRLTMRTNNNKDHNNETKTNCLNTIEDITEREKL